MRALVVGLALIALSGTAHAKTKVADTCTTTVIEALQHMAADDKNLSVSPSLTAKQYAFLKAEIKAHSPKTAIPGDGAFVISSEGEFIAALIKGNTEDAKLCAVMGIPAALVEGIVAIDAPPKPTAAPAVKDDPKAPWL